MEHLTNTIVKLNGETEAEGPKWPLKIICASTTGSTQQGKMQQGTYSNNNWASVRMRVHTYGQDERWAISSSQTKNLFPLFGHIENFNTSQKKGSNSSKRTLSYPTRYPGDVSNKRTTKLGKTED